ncbi:phage shock envelope stress response protein PspM [Actinophytocola gossypii]|uniref:Uncharacterized protein n=1 Tax=Actinophytocola gossypii TaxID=2812003 RepID=A0ABT2JBC6_9PSEU|nr:hypothetical protein [Actinophytocola gossypii]MCT2585026.1 hypothetical protein [Actinophytocola gossypii]
MDSAAGRLGHLWAARWVVLWVLVMAVFGVLMGAEMGGPQIDVLPGGDSAHVTGFVLTLISGTLAFRSTRRVVLTRRGQRDLAVGRGTRGSRLSARKLPPEGSAAREPMRELATVEPALDQVLKPLSGSAGPVPAESVAQAKATAAETAAALRAAATRLVAVEVARDHAPEDEREALAESVRQLRARLDEGVRGYRGLIAAAGRVVAATSLAESDRELTAAIEHLAGLAMALRELPAR